MEDFRQIEQIWNGNHPEDGSPLVVEDGPLGPDIEGEMFKDVAERMFGKGATAKAGRRR